MSTWQSARRAANGFRWLCGLVGDAVTGLPSEPVNGGNQ